MGFSETIVAVLGANLLTLILVWGLWQLNQNNERAPWAAYIAVLLPCFMVIFGTYVIAG